MWELTKSFRFEAAHAVAGTTRGPASEEIHGHSYRAEVTIRGAPDPASGMIVDLGLLEQRLEAIRGQLDHKLLNRINALGPPTLEHLARFIFDDLQAAGDVTRVTVFRDSCGESCTYQESVIRDR
ncbi:MAG TPA: 6-carboxytetrahydropterin synthase [Xanthobacteraceae bacterium]